MAGIVYKYDIIGLTILTNASECISNVLSGRFMVSTIVHQNQHVFF